MPVRSGSRPLRSSRSRRSAEAATHFDVTPSTRLNIDNRGDNDSPAPRARTIQVNFLIQTLMLRNGRRGTYSPLWAAYTEPPRCGLAVPHPGIAEAGFEALLLTTQHKRTDDNGQSRKNGENY